MSMVKGVLFMDKIKVVDKLAHTIAVSLAGVGGVKGDTGLYTWPSPVFLPVEGEIYLASYFLPTLYKDIKGLEKKGYSKEKIAKLLKAPSRIAQTTWPICNISLTDLSKDEGIDLAFKIIELISEFREDPFCEDLRNIIWSNEEVKDTISKTDMVDLGTVDNPDRYREKINRLNGIAWLYCEMLYTSIHGAGHEFHGPYNLGDSRILVVKEYYDLKPDFWPFTSKLPFNKITMLGIYKDADINFDFFNRTRSTKPLGAYLQRFSVIIDDKIEPLNIDEIQGITNDLERVLRDVLIEIRNLNKKELMKKFFQSYYFVIKPLREELKQDWWPPNALYEDLENEKRKKIVDAVFADFKGLESKSMEEFVQIISTIFNPRLREH